MPHIISHSHDAKCSHPLFTKGAYGKKKQTGHKKNELHTGAYGEEEPNKKVPVTYDSVKNAVIGDSGGKKGK
jgi:hypothetical protein